MDRTPNVEVRLGNSISHVVLCSKNRRRKTDNRRQDGGVQRSFGFECLVLSVEFSGEIAYSVERAEGVNKKGRKRNAYGPLVRNGNFLQ